MATKTTYRQTSARLIGPYTSGTATSGSSTAQLEDTGNLKSTISQDDLYTDQYLYRPSAASTSHPNDDRVRIIDSYDASNGLLVPHKVWTNAAYSGSTGESYEIHGLIEPHTEMTQLINDVLLQLTFVNVEFTFTPTASKYQHSLASAASWLKERAWIRQAGWLASGELRTEVNPFQRVLRGETEQNGNAFSLWIQQGFDGTETVYVRALKPAYYHCKATGGSFGGQSGLSLETDEAPIPEDWVAAGVRVLVWDRMNTLLSPGDEQRTKRERAEAAAVFNYLTRIYFKPYEMTFQELTFWGPQGGVPR